MVRGSSCEAGVAVVLLRVAANGTLLPRHGCGQTAGCKLGIGSTPLPSPSHYGWRRSRRFKWCCYEYY
jgi:hypothetical protein